jgi:hypothetical protein
MQFLVGECIRKIVGNTVDGNCGANLASVSNEIRKTIILPVVLYGLETWSFTVKKKYTIMVFENTVMRRILGPKNEERCLETKFSPKTK